MNRRTLFERNELGRPPKALVRPILMRPDGTSLVLGPFAVTKGPRLPGRNPATIINSKNSIWWNVLEMMILFPPNQSKGNGNAYISIRRPADASARNTIKIVLKHLLSGQFLIEGKTLSPLPETTFRINVACRSNVDEPTTPRQGARTGELKTPVRIIGTGNHDTWKGKRMKGHWRKTNGF